MIPRALPRLVRRPLYNFVLKTVTTYPPPTHTFLKWPFLTDFNKHTHTPPPPRDDDILVHWTKS